MSTVWRKMKINLSNNLFIWEFCVRYQLNILLLACFPPVKQLHRVDSLRRWMFLELSVSQIWRVLWCYIVLCRVAEKPGAAPAPTEVPAAAPTKKLENLFFIEEPKTTHVTESETHNVNRT